MQFGIGKEEMRVERCGGGSKEATFVGVGSTATA